MAAEPIAEFGFPGPLRDRLVGAILRGEKTATSSLHVGYADDPQGFPQTGDVEVVIDSLGQPVAEIETVEVRVLRVADVDIGFARDEGEGFDSVAEWRREHERFWQSDEVRAELGQPEFRVDDDTLIVAQRFRLVRELG
ncbi:MAG: ASCH domain-containing protein [Gaiellales bacterium]